MTLIRHLVDALVNPYFMMCVLLFFATTAQMLQRNLKRARQCLIIATLTVFIFSTGWLPKWLTYYLEHQYPMVHKPDNHIKWVVVFGGGQATGIQAPVNDLLYSASIRRLLEGVRLYHQLPNATLLLSGGEYNEQPQEARRMAELASWFKIAPSDLILELKSHNTQEQAQFIKQWVKHDPFYLVTSAIHMPRAMTLCHQQGLRPIAAPTDFTYFWFDERWQKMIIPNPNNLVYFNIAWHEILGRIWAWIIR